MQISRRKRKFSKRSRRHTQKCAARRELTSWFTCVTLSVLYCLFVVLLTKCMDVEKNPGPDENFVTLMQNVDWRFSQIMRGIQMHTAHINCKMDEKFGSLERTLGQLTSDVNKLKQYVGKDREDIQLRQEDDVKIVQRLEQLEQELNSLDVDSRRCNLKFLGVREPTRDNYRANVNEIVDALNECHSSRTWEHSDIQRAHRIGARRQGSDQPRPLVVEFHRWSDRIEILTDGALRDLLRQEAIRVTSYLTTRQRNEI